ncbi:MAG: RloB family protein [Bryobacteraceae bacterium]|nr:RloB family protein [Bryobacteraceae bacterium]
MAKTDRLRRRRPVRDPYPRVLIVCEGKKTESGYFKDLHHQLRLPIDLDIDAGGVPKTLVERAAARKKESERQSRRNRDSTFRFDEIWCVFDVDEHPNLAEARNQASANQLGVAISNPCFELWVLLHFQDQRGHIHRHEVQKLCREHMPGYDKTLTFKVLESRTDAALQRAAELSRWQEERGEAGANPSTGVHRLVERLLSVRRERG